MYARRYACLSSPMAEATRFYLFLDLEMVLSIELEQSPKLRGGGWSDATRPHQTMRTDERPGALSLIVGKATALRLNM